MKKKIASFLSIFLLISLLWAQRPTSDFPYYYYNISEQSFSEYETYFNGYYKVETIENNSDQIIKMTKDGNIYYIWTMYKTNRNPSESDIKQTLKNYQSVAANLDKKLDNKKNTDMSVCFIFTDSCKKLICAAKYSSN